MTEHSFRVTRTTLSDGRELLYFDDSPEYVSGERTRELHDSRDLPQSRTNSEVRIDPLTGEPVVFAAHRMDRTFLPPAHENPLAPTRSEDNPTEIPADDYDVVVFENRFPSFSLTSDHGPDFDHHVDGEELFERSPAVARCEVVCFTSDPDSSFSALSPQRARTVIEAWAHRTAELSPTQGHSPGLPLENRGEEIGVTLGHPHGQIYSYPYLPTRARAIVNRAKAHKEATGRDLFDDILAAERRSGNRIVHEGKFFTAFVPAAAKWPVEIMIMPHRAVRDFTELRMLKRMSWRSCIWMFCNEWTGSSTALIKTPYLASWNQAPVGEDRDYGRLHLQLFSTMRSPHRMKFLASSESGAGAWISDTTPERIAQRFREIA